MLKILDKICLNYGLKFEIWALIFLSLRFRRRFSAPRLHLTSLCSYKHKYDEQRPLIAWQMHEN